MRPVFTKKASEFKARCFRLMGQLRDFKTRITLTKRTKHFARPVPTTLRRSFLYGSLPVKIKGDIVAPIDEVWDAER